MCHTSNLLLELFYSCFFVAINSCRSQYFFKPIPLQCPRFLRLLCILNIMSYSFLLLTIVSSIVFLIYLYKVRAGNIINNVKLTLLTFCLQCSSASSYKPLRPEAIAPNCLVYKHATVASREPTVTIIYCIIIKLKLN